jgi:hypothetical protein
MNTIASIAPTRPEPDSLTLAAIARFIRHHLGPAEPQMANHTRTGSREATQHKAPTGKPLPTENQKVSGHTVKRAREGSPFHRQALALLDRRDRIEIKAACGSWRS